MAAKRHVVVANSPDGKNHRRVWLDAESEDDARDIVQAQQNGIAEAEAEQTHEDISGRLRYVRSNTYQVDTVEPEA